MGSAAKTQAGGAVPLTPLLVRVGKRSQRAAALPCAPRDQPSTWVGGGRGLCIPGTWVKYSRRIIGHVSSAVPWPQDAGVFKQTPMFTSAGSDMHAFGGAVPAPCLRFIPLSLSLVQHEQWRLDFGAPGCFGFSEVWRATTSWGWWQEGFCRV